MGPKLETFERTLAFVGSREHPLLVVQDYLRTSAPTTFDWLLHALNPMIADSREGSVSIRDGNAQVYVRLAASVPYRFEQRTGFPIEPEFAANTAYVLGKESFTIQSHLKATTEVLAQEVKFLAVLAPYRVYEARPEIVTVKSGNSVGFRIGGTEVLAWWGPGPHGNMSLGESTGDGRLILRTSESGKTSSVVAK
jgi:hypothetical protein